MKTVGIIAEYNPFHKGHQYQLDYVRNVLGADYIVIAMSTDFVQRGTPALFSKYVRTQMALRCGADLVVELPVSVSSASAEFFAGGGVDLLEGLGVVDSLCFGSETGQRDVLMDLAGVLVAEPEDYREALQKNLKDGMNFPAARCEALVQYLGKEACRDVLLSPNNILGIEYCKALLRKKSRIKPVALKRKGSGYHETELSGQQFASASGIRQALKAFGDISENNRSLLKQQFSDFIPDNILELFCQAILSNAFVTEEDFTSLFHYRLFLEDQESLSRYLDISPALARRIFHLRNEFSDFSGFAKAVKTKEITQTRVQRGLLHMLLGITAVPREIPYARVLGFRKQSTPLLTKIKQYGTIPLLTKLAAASAILDEEGMRLLEETTFASNIYQGILREKTGTGFVHEYSRPVIIL